MEEKKEVFIGAYKVQDYIKGVVTLEDGAKYDVHKDLYEKIVSETEGSGTPLDVIRAVLAEDVFTLLAHYDLDWSGLESVLQGVSVLCSNLQEAAIAKKFNCNGIRSMKLMDMLDAK